MCTSRNTRRSSGQQHDDLIGAKLDLERKAAELVRANRYKSEFLANMSHELRTPLNSSLILAKLLADNRDANLTPEQVKYARGITSAGNDLLALINDILDLSKIEARKIDLTHASINIGELAHRLSDTFEPMALEKQILFRVYKAPDLPPTIDTDVAASFADPEEPAVERDQVHGARHRVAGNAPPEKRQGRKRGVRGA